MICEFCKRYLHPNEITSCYVVDEGFIKTCWQCTEKIKKIFGQGSQNEYIIGR